MNCLMPVPFSIAHAAYKFVNEVDGPDIAARFSGEIALTSIRERARLTTEYVRQYLRRFVPASSLYERPAVQVALYDRTEEENWL